MGPQYPIFPNIDAHHGAKVDPTPIRWGDPVWDSVVSPVLAELEGQLSGTARGGPVFARVVRAWKDGVQLGSNKAIAVELGWEVGEVVEGFRLVRDRLKEWRDPVLELRVREYTRELVITPRGGVRAKGDLLLSIGGGRPELAGRALAGATSVAKGRGMRLICEQPETAEEQARVLDPAAYAGYLILPVDETDDFGAVARLGNMSGRVALLDVSTRNATVPCVSFDYAGAGLYSAQKLMELGCTDIVVLARDHDSRTFAIGEGCRRAVRRAEGPLHRMATVDESAVETLCSLQQRGLLTRNAGKKLGILCADGELGEAVLRYLDGQAAGSWDVAVAVVGGKRWAACHWAELIWVELDYAELAAAGAKYLCGAQGSTVPQVKPRYEVWTPKKPVGSAAGMEQEIWRPMLAG